ncbi:putative transcription factor C2H2 family [Helianthus anomalus]
MSSGVSTGGSATVAAPQLYFCYQCNRTVSISPSPTAELICPNCNEGFLEEYENPNPNPPNPFLAFDDPSPFASGFPLLFPTSSRHGGSTGDFQNPSDLSALFGGPISRTGSGGGVQNHGEFNPFAFLQNYLSTLRAGGANIQFVIENSSDGDGAGFRVPSNLGDYFIGPGLEQLIQQLAENDPNRYGTPPAAKSVVENLPSVKISKELMESDYSDCAVCKDSFELDEDVKKLPCKHMYHPDCIIPWLELHNSCPVCRFELPTDDPDYENRDRQTSTGGAQGDPLTPGERRFRINLPWPFTGYGTSAEASNSGSGNNNSSRDGGNQGSGGGGGQARQEDLD